MKIYVTRHGQTDFNKQDRILGTTDMDINETGLQQAHALAEKVAELNVDIMIVSPMKRTMTTAGIVSEKTGLEIITDPRLREWNYGEYEALSRFTEGFEENKINFAVRMGKNGESVLQLAHRVYSALDDIIENYHDKTVLIVCHGGVCRIINTYFNDVKTADFPAWTVNNCEILEYDVQEDGNENRR